MASRLKHSCRAPSRQRQGPIVARSGPTAIRYQLPAFYIFSDLKQDFMEVKGSEISEEAAIARYSDVIVIYLVISSVIAPGDNLVSILVVASNRTVSHTKVENINLI